MSENDAGRHRAADEIENELTRRFIQGDRHAFEAVVRQHQERITRLVWRLTGWAGRDVDDLVQDVFLAIYTNQKKFNGRGTVGSWLSSIAINRCRLWHRREKLTAAFLRKTPPLDNNDNSPAGYQSLVQAETAQQVRQAIRVLPGPLREVTVLRYLEQMDSRQIAALLKIKSSAVEVRLTRARQRLKELLPGTIMNMDKL